MNETPDTLRAAFRPHDWNEESKYAVAWMRDNVGIPAAAAWEEQVRLLTERVERLGRAVRSAQHFVDSPAKFGQRHTAYMQMRKAVEAALHPEDRQE